MKRLPFILAFLAAPVFAQSPVLGGIGVTLVTTAPSGACILGSQGQLVSSTGAIWTCQSGTWTSISGGGGGAPTGPAGGDLSGTYPNPTVKGANGIAFALGDTSNYFMGTTAAPNPGIDNTVLGVNACPALTHAPNTSAQSAFGNVCLGWHAGQNLTTGALSILIGNQAGAVLTGTGTPIDDTIVTMIGAGAGQNLLSTGTASAEDVFIGEDAGSGITHSTFDVILGNHALTPVSGTTTQNVILGHNAMATDNGANYVITGDVVIGQEAVAFSSQGNSNNVLIGQDAVNNFVNGTNDVFIGQGVAPAYTGGGNNTVVGQDAAPNMTTGHDNIAIGLSSGFSDGAGNNNISLGTFSGGDNGSDNVEIGHQTGAGSTGSNIVAIGGSACTGMTGGNNTCLGAGARNSGTVGTGTENALVGHNAGIAQNISNSVQLGQGTNGANNSLQFLTLPLAGTVTFTASGCTNSTLVGGATAGSYHSGTTGTCTVVVTTGLTAPNGWACFASDLTTTADTIKQTATSQTTATLAGTTASGDVINFGCQPY